MRIPFPTGPQDSHRCAFKKVRSGEEDPAPPAPIHRVPDLRLPSVGGAPALWSTIFAVLRPRPHRLPGRRRSGRVRGGRELRPVASYVAHPTHVPFEHKEARPSPAHPPTHAGRPHPDAHVRPPSSPPCHSALRCVCGRWCPASRSPQFKATLCSAAFLPQAHTYVSLDCKVRDTGPRPRPPRVPRQGTRRHTGVKGSSTEACRGDWCRGGLTASPEVAVSHGPSRSAKDSITDTSRERSATTQNVATHVVLNERTPSGTALSPTAVGYPPTAVGYPPIAVSYPPTA